MIVKEKDSARPTDPMGSAGYETEKQMAFFLRRAFAESDDVLVLNDVTFERSGERAQIDHLVLHRFGFRQDRQAASELPQWLGSDRGGEPTRFFT